MTQKTDYFISYSNRDQAWAEWIGYSLLGAGYTVLLKAWDLRPGNDFASEISSTVQNCERIITVMSRSYLTAMYLREEWKQVFAANAHAPGRQIIPIRVESCNFSGLLSSRVTIDLVDLEESQARQRLLDGILYERGTEASPPAFPGNGNSAPAPVAQTQYYPPTRDTFDIRTLPESDAARVSMRQGEHFLDQLPSFLMANPKFKCIAFFDIDGQGGINKNYSRITGNRVIQRVAQTIDRETDSNGTFHRCGDDTFFVLLPLSIQSAIDEATRILKNIESDYLWEELHKDLKVTCSAAVSAFPDRASRTEQEIDDTALRAAIGCRSARLVHRGNTAIEGPTKLSAEDPLMKPIKISRRIKSIHSGGVLDSDP